MVLLELGGIAEPAGSRINIGPEPSQRGANYDAVN